MKKIYKTLIIAMSSILITNCSTEEKAIDEVNNNFTKGAVLKTIKEDATFDFFNTSSTWSVNLEEQDELKGGLFSKIKLYVKHTTNGVTTAEKLLKTVPASAFSPGPYGFPRGVISVTLSDVLAILNIAPNGYTTSDTFAMRLELELTDGRKFSAENSGGTVVGGSFFNSPFAYTALFFCPYTDASKYNGDYKVITDTRNNYPIGSIVPVVYNTANGVLKFRILNSNNPVLVNTSSYYEVTIDDSDDTVTVVSNEDLNFGGGVLTKVTGTGSIGSCSGDINLILKFSDSPKKEEFNLVKN
jgi:hypothetical protein